VEPVAAVSVPYVPADDAPDPDVAEFWFAELVPLPTVDPPAPFCEFMFEALVPLLVPAVVAPLDPAVWATAMPPTRSAAAAPAMVMIFM
jgi:hypothetical protein